MKKYLDWRGWLEGLYLSWIKTLTSTLLTYAGTNGLEQLGLKGVGLSWKQGLAMVGAITFWEVIRYLNAKPKPELVEEIEQGSSEEAKKSL